MEKFYVIFSLLILFAVVMTIISTNPIHSVFWLVLVFLKTASLFILLGYQFLGLMLVIIYVGAITILFLFVIMMLDVLQLKKIYNVSHLLPILLIVIFQFIGSWNRTEFFNQINILWEFNFNFQINLLGLTLYSDFGLPFILISILLLIAMVGAIVLTLENNMLTKHQSSTKQHHRNNSWT